MKRKHIFLPDTIIERLHKLSVQTGRRVADLIRQAISEFLDRMEGGNK